MRSVSFEADEIARVLRRIEECAAEIDSLLDMLRERRLQQGEVIVAVEYTACSARAAERAVDRLLFDHPELRG